MRHILVVLMMVGCVAGAEAQEVFNPWDDATNRTATRPAPLMVRGDRVALRALGAQIPAWALNEVLNPWGNPTPASSMRPQERALSMAARARASRLSACFPAQHSRPRHWTQLDAPGATSTGGAISDCLRQVLDDIRPASATFVLALRFDDQGLRDVYVLKEDRS
ncbi:MAG: hypothetical protein AB8H86_32725 [Polyangiales bacterium]